MTTIRDDDPDAPLDAFGGKRPSELTPDQRVALTRLRRENGIAIRQVSMQTIAFLEARRTGATIEPDDQRDAMPAAAVDAIADAIDRGAEPAIREALAARNYPAVLALLSNPPPAGRA